MRSHTACNEAARVLAQLYIFECLVVASIVLRVSNWNPLFNRELPALFVCTAPLCFSAAEVALQRIRAAHAMAQSKMLFDVRVTTPLLFR